MAQVKKTQVSPVGLQLSLFSEPETVILSGDYVSLLIEQIRRDRETLSNPEYHVEEDPAGRAFYEERIQLYRDEVKRCRA